MACSSPPKGRARWPLELLAGELVRLTEHDHISRETVRRRLAENELKPWRKDMWCIPQVDGEMAGVPFALGHGTGAELRQPLGYAMVGGLALSQLLTLYTTPVVYLYLDRLQSWLKRAPAHGPEELRATAAVVPLSVRLKPGE
jgi:hypothetical protein